MNAIFYLIIDRESENPSLSYNGGDYDFWRVIAVQDGKPIAVSYRTSSDFDYCNRCGHFVRNDDCWCSAASPEEAYGWEAGELLVGKDAANEEIRLGLARWYNHIRPTPEFLT